MEPLKEKKAAEGQGEEFRSVAWRYGAVRGGGGEGWWFERFARDRGL